MNQVHRTIQTDESWRLEALGRATRPKPGPEPRNIAIGAHDTPEALVERVTGAIHGVAWWLTHGNYTATGPSHTNRVAETLATPWGKRTTQRWVLGEQGQAARSHAPLAIDNALNAVESRTVQHAPTRT